MHAEFEHAHRLAILAVFVAVVVSMVTGDEPHKLWFIAVAGMILAGIAVFYERLMPPRKPS